MNEVEFILYVADQELSKKFYSSLFCLEPCLDVPGMTEFNLCPNVKLGLMLEVGIAKIIGQNLPHPKEGNGIPRCELYLKVPHANRFVEKGIELGGSLISQVEPRDWGDTVGYLSDPDGNVIAFAEANQESLVR